MTYDATMLPRHMALALEHNVSGHTSKTRIKVNQVHVSTAPSLHSCNIPKI